MLAIRAPAGTTLEVPDPDEGLHGTGKRRFQIFLRSQDGAVTTFLVSSARDDSQTMPSKPVGTKENCMQTQIAHNQALVSCYLQQT